MLVIISDPSSLPKAMIRKIINKEITVEILGKKKPQIFPQNSVSVLFLSILSNAAILISIL